MVAETRMARRNRSGASTKKEKKKGGWLSELVSYVILLVGVFVASLAIQTYVLTSFKVSGESMYPTFKNNDSVLMYRLGTPSRFDVVVIESPDNTYETDAAGNIKKDWFGNDVRKLYIKRVIGLPGDTIEYRDDVLYINGQAYDEPYLDASRTQAHNQGLLYMQNTNLESMIARAQSISPDLPADNFTLATNAQGQYVVPEGHYFVLGDNRSNSKDGDEYGLVNKNLLKGVAILRFYPFDSIKTAPFE